MSSERYQRLWRAYRGLWSKEINSYSLRRLRLHIPVVPGKMLSDMISEVSAQLLLLPQIITVEEDCLVVGDIRGSIADLLMVMKLWSVRDQKRIIFAGNILGERGFALEVLEILITSLILYPERFILIRGENEFEGTEAFEILRGQLQEKYKSDLLLKNLSDMFSMLPHVVKINNEVLVLHGGIGPGITRLSNFPHIKRPLFAHNELSKQLFLSEPTDVIKQFLPSSSHEGYVFGSLAVSKFLSDNSLDCIIIGHTLREEGVRKMFDGALFIVSTCNCDDRKKTKSGIISYEAGKVSPIVWDAFKPLLRHEAVFQKSCREDEFSLEDPNIPLSRFSSTNLSGNPMLHPNGLVPEKLLLGASRDRLEVYLQLPKLFQRRRSDVKLQKPIVSSTRDPLHHAQMQSRRSRSSFAGLSK